MEYGLPKKLNINGKSCEIRTDFRDILTIIDALNDPDLDDNEKVFVLLNIMFLHVEDLTNEDYQEAVKQAMWFINCGDDNKGKNKRKLMDWQQDYKLIIAPINRVIGHDVRGDEYCHWWTFMSAYMEIGECTFSQIVNIRQKRSRGEPLEKWEQKWASQNADIVNLKSRYTEQEKQLLASLKI